MSDDSWRKDGTCGACSHFVRDFGSPPTLYGHCKMYGRSGSRTSGDSTCHEFKPLPGFEDKVVLTVRTHVPDSPRAARRPVTVPVDSIIKRRGDDGARAAVVRRRDGDEAEVPPEEARRFFAPTPAAAPPEPPDEDEDTADDAAETVVGRLSAAQLDPGGGADPVQLEDALLDVVEAFGALSPVSLADYAGGMMVLAPADSALKPHEIEIEALFHKFVMSRDRLRVLEQKVNGHKDLGDLDKIELHGPITRVYAALTAFNSLFRASAPGWRRRRATRRPLEDLLRRHAPRSATELGGKWVGGSCRLVPAADADAATLELSIDLLFDRVCRLKRRLRELQGAVTAVPGLADERDALLDYLAKIRGSLTTFNVLFRHREDWFRSK